MTKREQNRVFKWILNHPRIVPGHVYLPVFNLYYPNGRFEVGDREVTKEEYQTLQKMWDAGTSRNDAAIRLAGLFGIKLHKAWGMMEETFGI